MAVNVQIIFYSLYGHIHRMAEAVAEGARQVPGANVQLYQVQELIPEEALVRTGAKQARQAFAHVPFARPEQLPNADAIIFGVPTRYGGVVAQIQNFIDQTGQLWLQGALIGKVGSVFTSTATQHGGQETTIRSLHTELFHHGMVVVGVPYSCQELMNMNEITGGSPYGAGTLAGTKGERLPSENELKIARFQGKHVTQIAAKLTSK
ncbi:MAG TPA: NAD(P)H:quinone oxidoreductase [Tepidisphaeraceae bacterium]|nr:NAD(P)H:quinone oxidoreductase [Tepidisphaeraceae bacterium]